MFFESPPLMELNPSTSYSASSAGWSQNAGLEVYARVCHHLLSSSEEYLPMVLKAIM